MTLVARSTMALGLVALAASCGGGSNETQAPVSGTQAATEPTETQPSLSVAEAKVLAASMNLRLTDFPSGWRADPPGEDDQNCSALESLKEKYDLAAREPSKKFAHGDITYTYSTANLFNDEATARDALNYVEGSIQSDEFRDCVSEGLRRAVQEGVTIGEITVGQVSFPTLGERSSAWEIAVPIEAEGSSATAYFDVVFIVQGNAMSSVDFFDLGSPFDEQERERLSRLVEDRMETAVEKEG